MPTKITTFLNVDTKPQTFRPLVAGEEENVDEECCLLCPNNDADELFVVTDNHEDEYVFCVSCIMGLYKTLRSHLSPEPIAETKVKNPRLRADIAKDEALLPYEEEEDPITRPLTR